MIGAIWNGHSGLTIFDKAIAVESNNATNNTTVANKLDQVSFVDMFYKNGYGNGVDLETISKVFTQGELQPSSVNYDVAMEGKGFFITTENTKENIDKILKDETNDLEFYYSRAGNFKKIYSAETDPLAEKRPILGSQENFAVLGIGLNDLNKIYKATNPDEAAQTGFTTKYTNYVATADIMENTYFAVVDQNPDPDIYDPIIDDSIEYTQENRENPDIKFYNQNSIITNINIKTTDYTKTVQGDDISLSGNNYKTLSSKLNDLDLLKIDLIEKLSLYQSNPNDESEASQKQISFVDYSSMLNQLNDENDALTVTLDGKVFRQNFVNSVEDTLKALSDQISNTQGFEASTDTANGTLQVQKLVAGDSFSIVSASVNAQYVPIYKVQDAKLGSGEEMLNVARQAYKSAVEEAGGSYLEVNTILTTNDNFTKELRDIGIPFSSSEMILEEIPISLKYENLVEGVEGKLEISNDGLVYLIDEESRFLVGKIQTASFANEQGLDPMGGNTFRATKESGAHFNGDSLNKIVSNYLERANNNFSNTLSSILVYQKAFEANSKSITISDEFLKTAIDMKK